MDRNNYVDADYAREEKKGQGMAWARPKKKAAGQALLKGFRQCPMRIYEK